MKKFNGFSLIEAMVVLAIFALVITFGIPAFSTWNKKQDAEGQISKLYNDLQYTRMKAYSDKVVCGIWWGGSSTFTSYILKEDGNSASGTAPDGDIDDASGTDEFIETVASKYSITTTNNATNRLEFDGRGFSRNLASFYIPSSSGAAQDCLTVSRTRIIMGRWNGTNCIPK